LNVSAEFTPDPEFKAPDGYAVLSLRSVDSTSDEALRHLNAGCETPLWVVADEQTQGRGRSGRVWHSPPGNLYASLLVTLRISPAAATQLSFVAGLAAHEAIARFLPIERRSALKLKWPNDVLCGGAKLAGILLESLTAPNGQDLAVILGIGINVAHAPSGTGREVTSLGLPRSSIPEVFNALAACCVRWLGVWNEGGGFPAIREAWLERAFALDEPISVNLNGTVIQGKFCGIDFGGALQLETHPGVVMRVTAGDIYPDLGHQHREV
jgi:BirA family biotin operon repressor/biotin-[acetyl-CoA-carboxylase] ligase